MEQTIIDQLALQDQKIEAIYVSVERTRKYLLIVMWSTIAMIALPLLAALVIVPLVLSSLATTYSGLL